MSNLSTNPMDPNSLVYVGQHPGYRKRKDREALVDNLMNKHMVEYLERFEWSGLPDELPQDIIERVLFFRGKGAMFQYLDTFYFLPFALDGTIDSYGRYATINPTLFTGQFDSAKNKWDEAVFLPEAASDTKFVVSYSVKPSEATHPAVILTDQSLGISQDLTPHSERVKVLLERMVNTLMLIEINNINGVQTYAMFVSDQAQKDAVEEEFNNYDTRILEGKRVTVVVGDTTVEPFKELTAAKNISDSQRYWQSYQAWDNLRKELIGLDSGGTNMKMEHVTSEESQMNGNMDSLVMSNALRMRLDFCDIINAQWGLSVSVNEVEYENDEMLADEGAQSEEINDQVGE